MFEDSLLPTEDTGMPWTRLYEAGYRIVGMNHYRKNGTDNLFVAMTKGDKCIKEEGPNERELFMRLEVKAKLAPRSFIPPKEKKAGDPRHKEFIAEWMGAYREFFNRDYSVTMPQDGAALKRFLGSNKQPVAELIKVAQDAWQYRLDNNFCQACKRTGSIAAFCNAWNEINTELDSIPANNKSSSRL